MKKFLLVFMALMCCFLLISCEDPEYQETTDASQETTDDPSVETKSAIINRSASFCETPTRILYLTGNCELVYYNKLDGGAYTFCFDPLCKHQRNCISQKFLSLSNTQPICYREEENRFYALRGKNLLSFSFDGSDIQRLYTAGDDDWQDTIYDMYAIKGLALSDDYAYFTVQNEKNGNHELYRYSFKTKKAENVMPYLDMMDNVYSFNLINGELLIEGSMNREISLYWVDEDFTNIRKLSINFYPSDLFDGNSFYYVSREETSDREEDISNKIVKYDINTGEETTLCERDFGSGVTILASTERYLYYSISRGIVIGQITRPMGDVYDVVNTRNNIWRYDMETEEHLQVFCDDYFCVTDIFLMDSQVLIKGKQFTTIGENTVSKMCIILADIDENGNFMNIRVLEES